MHGVLRHCLALLLLAAVACLVAWPLLAAGWAILQGQPHAPDWPRYLWVAALASAGLCALRLGLALLGQLLRLALRSY